MYKLCITFLVIIQDLTLVSDEANSKLPNVFLRHKNSPNQIYWIAETHIWMFPCPCMHQKIVSASLIYMPGENNYSVVGTSSSEQAII